jgi:hypothetical protein
MGRDELIRLMADVLDGVAGSAGEARLSARLAADPEARELFEEARMGKRSMEGIAPRPAPDGLREAIRRSVELEPRTTLKGAGWLVTWRAALRRRPAFGLVPAFALGAIVGIVVFASVTSSRFPTQGAATPIGGTMQSVDREPGGRVLDQVDMDAVTLATWRDRDQVIVRVRVKRATNPRIELTFGPAALRMSSIRWPSGAGGDVEAVPGSIRLTPGGPGECVVSLRALADPAGAIRAIISDTAGTREAVMRTGF